MEAKKNLRARKYTSPLLEEVLNSLTDVEKEQSRLRLTIAARIDDYRKARDLSKGDLASKLGKRPSEATKWMSGTHNFTIDTLVEIALALEVTIKDLMTYYHEEHKVNRELCLQSFELIPVIVPMTPASAPNTGKRFGGSMILENIVNGYTTYVA